MNTGQEKEKQEREQRKETWQETENQEQEPAVREKIDIPGIVYQGSDKKLKERVFKFKEGFLRIAVFTVMGLFMGYFSHTYVTDHFFPTKLILAVPYKINEAIYVSILGTDAPSDFAGRTLYTWMTEYFPHSMPATFVAEVVTTILIGGAIYGSLAYFTGDKRVFTLRRFLKFAGCWCVLILLCIGAAYGINAKAVADNEKLLGEPVFWMQRKEGGFIGSVGKGEEAMLKEALYSQLDPMTVQRVRTEEIPLEIRFDGMRSAIYWVNCEKCYLATEGGKTYRISQAFARLVWNFYEKGEMSSQDDGEEGQVKEQDVGQGNGQQGEKSIEEQTHSSLQKRNMRVKTGGAA